VPFATVVTDLGSAHRTWFDKRVDACFVPSDAVRQLAGRCGLRCGARGAQVRQYGLPVRPAFWTAAAERKQLAGELELSTDRKTVLIVGGGDGVGSLEGIVKSLASEAGKKCPGETQLVVVCGPRSETRMIHVSQNQHSRGHVFSRIHPYSAVFTVFFSVVLTRCSLHNTVLPP